MRPYPPHALEFVAGIMELPIRSRCFALRKERYI